MKKLVRFFAVAAIIAAGFTGCTEETQVPIPDPDDQTNNLVDVPEVPTYATFEFQFEGAPITRAMVTDAYESQTGTAGSENITSIRLLVFEVKANDAGLCLADTTVSTFGTDPNPPARQSATVLVTSGQKRLLVIANTRSHVTDSMNQGATTLKGVDYATFLASHNLYDIGTPAIAPNVAPTSLDFSLLVNATSNTSGVLLYSNTLEDTASVRTLKPNIAYATSRNGTSIDDNKFTIYLKRAVAKAVAYYTGALVTGGSGDSTRTLNFDPSTGKGGTLTARSYNIRNINRGVVLFQKPASTGGPEAAYFNAYGTPAEDDQTPFTPYFYKDDDISTALDNVASTDPAPTAAGKAIYLTESNSAGGYHGAKSYFAFKAKYTPSPTTPVVASITGYDHTVGGGQFTLTHGNASDVIVSPGTFYQLTDSGAFGPVATAFTYPTTVSFPVKTLFKDSVSIKKVVWAKLNPAQQLPSDTIFFTFSTPAPAATFLLRDIKLYAREYKEGITYYRLNIYEGTDYKANNYVARNNHYKARITGFSDLGASEIDDLDTKPGGTNEQPTYVTATITVLPWVDVPTSSTVVPWPDL